MQRSVLSYSFGNTFLQIMEVTGPLHEQEPIGQPHLWWMAFAAPVGRLTFNDMHMLKPLPAATKGIPTNIRNNKEVDSPQNNPKDLLRPLVLFLFCGEVAEASYHPECP